MLRFGSVFEPHFWNSPSRWVGLCFVAGFYFMCLLAIRVKTCLADYSLTLLDVVAIYAFMHWHTVNYSQLSQFALFCRWWPVGYNNIIAKLMIRISFSDLSSTPYAEQYSVAVLSSNPRTLHVAPSNLRPFLRTTSNLWKRHLICLVNTHASAWLDALRLSRLTWWWCKFADLVMQFWFVRAVSDSKY